jgi:hypothetical protein
MAPVKMAKADTSESTLLSADALENCCPEHVAKHN